ncbi:DUF222 domain-containing protein [Nakamurella sp. A5-74]|uniref:DUF222 domain-containing protein n=1 Tax=Nakamurella sp. A5-74 TaxID=3158264 RepID=A0AAU8DRF8_9ACTN
MPATIPPLWLDENLVDAADMDELQQVDEFLEDRWIRLVTDDLQGQLLDLGPASTQAESIDRIASLQRLIATASSVLAAEEVAFASAEKQRQLDAGVKPRDLGRGTAEQLGFARRMSPAAAARHLGFAVALHERLPQIANQFRGGDISEAQARIAVTRTSHLSDTDAVLVDAGIAPRMSGWNLAATEKAIDHACYELDPHGFVDRARHASTERRVWVRPASDSMCIVSALLPVAEGVAVYANLRRAAETLIGTGESGLDPVTEKPKTLGQTMADLLVTRCTGQVTAAAVPVEIRITIGLDTLLGDGSTPAQLDGHGPIPAGVARAIAGNPEAESWVRRLFTEPVSRSPVELDERRRDFPDHLKTVIAARDRHCRQPYCSAPIRHTDHITPWSRGGSTTYANGQGLCARGNLSKDVPGWHHHRSKSGAVTITTPTGHCYTTTPPQALGLPAVTLRE